MCRYAGNLGNFGPPEPPVCGLTIAVSPLGKPRYEPRSARP